MNVILTAIVSALVLATVAGYVLARDQKTAEQAFATSGTRIGASGHNLVGRDWSGLNTDPQAGAAHPR